MRRCNLLITGDGVAIIQYRCHLLGWGVPWRRRSVAQGGGGGASSTPCKSATAYCCLVLPVICKALILRLGHRRRSACIDTDLLQLATAACCNVGWISAQRGVLCDWSVSKRLEACSNADGGHSEHVLLHCLPNIPNITTGSFQSHRLQPTS